MIYLFLWFLTRGTPDDLLKIRNSGRNIHGIRSSLQVHAITLQAGGHDHSGLPYQVRRLRTDGHDQGNGHDKHDHREDDEADGKGDAVDETGPPEPAEETGHPFFHDETAVEGDHGEGIEGPDHEVEPPAPEEEMYEAPEEGRGGDKERLVRGIHEEQVELGDLVVEDIDGEVDEEEEAAGARRAPFRNVATSSGL